MEAPPPPPYEEEQTTFFKYGLEFSEASIRAAFVKKVFSLVFIMLAIVTLLCALPFMIPSFRDWLTGSNGNDYSSGAAWVYITACVVFLVFAIVLSCCQKLTRKSPLNLILLGLFTLSAGVMVMCITAFFTVESVLLCLAMTAGSCGAVILFAMFTKRDLTSMIGFMFLFGIWLMFFGISASIAYWACGVTFLNTLYGALVAAFFLLWLAIDIQLMMGGKRYALSPEEYIFASMQIFLDIINIFLILLNIFGKLK